MRGVAVVIGGLLVVGGGVLVASADQQRVTSLEEARAARAHVQSELDATRQLNYDLAEKLTALRSQIAAQDTQLADSTGFLP